MSKFSQIISVVVIGRNEAARLERCLASVTSMDCQDFETEVIYVDSGSTDDSVALAERAGAKTVVLTVAHPTAALGRNAGWRLAKGSYVLFLDGDTVLDPRFVVQSLPDFGRNTAAVWGHRRELYPNASLYQRVLDLDWIYAAGESEFCGGDVLFRREVLERVKGFDANLIAGEEPELCRRVLEIGYVIQHVDRAMTGHDLSITRFGQYWRRAKRAGHAYAEVSERFAESSNPFWLRESRGNRSRALLLVLTAVLACVSAIVLGSFWPLTLWIASLCIVVVRTASKARWKTKSWNLLLIYAIHSQLQHIPIYVGQLQYQLKRRSGRRTGSFEYKEF